MNAGEKSDESVVPTTSANKDATEASAESIEGRLSAVRNTVPSNLVRTPSRSPHNALDALAYAIPEQRVGWILDADIKGFFDEIDRTWLIKFLEHRIGDKRIIRLIHRWLAAGIIEDTDWSDTGKGTPQGSVISPILANVFLHYVFDLWINQWRKRHCRGKCIVVRYADDFVIGFENESEARACLESLKVRLQQFGLELHPEKTRLLEFGRRGASPALRWEADSETKMAPW